MVRGESLQRCAESLRQALDPVLPAETRAVVAASVRSGDYGDVLCTLARHAARDGLAVPDTVRVLLAEELTAEGRPLYAKWVLDRLARAPRSAA